MAHKLQMLQAAVVENDLSFFRLLVDGRSIKYVTIEAGLYPQDDMCFGPSLVEHLLPIFPGGDWNDGLVAKDEQTGQPHFARTVKTTFSGIRDEELWHGTSIDYVDILVGQKLRAGMYEVTCPTVFNDTIVIAKFARFDWEIQHFENESRAYEWIEAAAAAAEKDDDDDDDNTYIHFAPRFLGYLTEEKNNGHSRVIGFLMERITHARHAEGVKDLAVCQETLSRLHQLGIRHGDLNRFQFLIVDENEEKKTKKRAVLMDFDTATKCDDSDALREEFESLEGCLLDVDARGGGGRLCSE
jgi:predicted Ser/Thr protein kinase